MTDFVDAYRILRVRPDASQEQLKTAHRRLVRRYHPDLVPADVRAAATRRVQEINMAYGLVRDPDTRGAYDRMRRLHLARQRVAAGEQTVAGADAALAEQWETAVRAAGRWAGRWWTRNRAPLRRGVQRAKLKVVRTWLDTFGRMWWLLSCVAGAAVGFAAGEGVQHLAGVSGGLTPAVGMVSGVLVGNQRGWQRRLRYAGFEVQRAARVTALGCAGAAVLAALWIEMRLG